MKILFKSILLGLLFLISSQESFGVWQKIAKEEPIIIDKELLNNSAIFSLSATNYFKGIDFIKVCQPKTIYLEDSNQSFPFEYQYPLQTPFLNQVQNIELNFILDSSLIGEFLFLNFYWQGAAEFYLNGELIYTMGRLPKGETSTQIENDYFQQRRYFPLRIKDYNSVNQLQIRFAQRETSTKILDFQSNVENRPFYLTLNNYKVTTKITEFEDTYNFQYGIFMGICLVLSLMAFLRSLGNQDSTSWKLISLFTLFSGLVALTNIVFKSHFGLTLEWVSILNFPNFFFYSVTVFFPPIILRSLFSKTSRKSYAFYTSFFIAYSSFVYIGSFTDTQFLRYLLPLVIIVAIDVVYLTWIAFKNKTTGRWILVIGVLIFLFQGVFYEALNEILDITLAPTMRLVMRSAYYLTMPLTFTIFLANQSSTNARLLSRQKEELDEEVTERTRELSIEKEKSDSLLLNILPKKIAQELKDKGSSEARKYENVTVMFTDFKDFSKISESMSAKDLVQEIDFLFKNFDRIISSYKIEKIKTIGDSYMCAAGVPKANKNHAFEMASAGLEILNFMKSHQEKQKKIGKSTFDIRIGIHSGPVIAGVVGSIKFAYDIWGPTVNIASRMESSGEPGKVNVSQTTYKLLGKDFKFIPRGKIETKNTGFLEMYFIEE